MSTTGDRERQRCRFCGIQRKATSALLIRMADGQYRCKGAVMCLRRVRALL